MTGIQYKINNTIFQINFKNIQGVNSMKKFGCDSLFKL